MLDFSGILRVLKLSECVEQSAIENIEKHLFDKTIANRYILYILFTGLLSGS